ncbi:hypothetical protein CASFOL_035509 [Castilleja foliolosa]|uniref:Rho termination factor-like N-terminal domain-containing protein n=1 Tax=Castilleja foliolosa TaxID=1961234 RepID=A0ABD3BV60_9LAMI
MSCSINFMSKINPGYSTIDAIYSSHSNTSRGDYAIISCVNFSYSRHRFRHTSICNASQSYHRQNPDFLKQKRKGFLSSENQLDEDKNGYDDFEESDFLTSKSVPLLENRKPQTTASPSSREKEIVELFRKVQVQLRERSSIKEEKKKVEKSNQGTSRENETVDSLLKILRKHSVQPEQIDNTSEHEMQESPILNPSHPKSNFSRRSPVPEMKSEALYHKGSVNSSPHGNLEADSDDANETEIGSGKVFDEIPDNGEEDDEQKRIEVGDVSGMKVVELRSIAKSRGMKGFSKMKKNEIIELLSGISI